MRFKQKPTSLHTPYTPSKEMNFEYLSSLSQLNVPSRDANRLRYLYCLVNKLSLEQKWPQVDRWLAKELKTYKSMGSQDRRWYAHFLFSALRHGLFLNFLCKVYSDGVSPKDLTSSDNQSYLLNVFAWLNDVSKSPKVFFNQNNLPIFLSFLYLRLTFGESGIESQDYFLSQWITWFSQNELLEVRCLFNGVPIWLSEQLNKRAQVSNWTNDELSLFLERLSTQPPLWVRWNSLDAGKDSHCYPNMRTALSVGDKAPQATSIESSHCIYSSPPYTQGVFEIQDSASQAIGQHVPLKKGDFVWDCCAGGGGKTIQLASRLNHSGAVYASDVRKYKLDEIKKRAKRCQFFNIRFLDWDGCSPLRMPKDVLKRGGFDSILVDAPCSASGTWRRNPDAKFRISNKEILELYNIQMSILEEVIKYLRPGGHLVYGTCSWLPQENEGVVQTLLQKQSSLKLVGKLLHGSPYWNSDTMFSACFQKIDTTPR